MHGRRLLPQNPDYLISRDQREIEVNEEEIGGWSLTGFQDGAQRRHGIEKTLHLMPFSGQNCFENVTDDLGVIDDDDKQLFDVCIRRFH
jgi:hypothetical protein